MRTIPLDVEWTWTVRPGEWCDDCGQPIAEIALVEFFTRRVLCAACASDLERVPEQEPLDVA